MVRYERDLADAHPTDSPVKSEATYLAVPESANLDLLTNATSDNFSLDRWTSSNGLYIIANSNVRICSYLCDIVIIPERKNGRNR